MAQGFDGIDATRFRFRAGVTVRSPEGTDARFDMETYHHWDGYDDQAKRATFLSWAKHNTVETPVERWFQDLQQTFIGAFAKPRGGFRGCVVAVRNDGVVNSYFVNDLKDLEKARHGLSVKIFSGGKEGRS